MGVDEVEHLADLIGFGHATFGALEIDKRNGRHRMNEDHVIADRAVVLKAERLNEADEVIVGNALRVIAAVLEEFLTLGHLPLWYRQRYQSSPLRSTRHPKSAGTCANALHAHTHPRQGEGSAPDSWPGAERRMSFQPLWSRLSSETTMRAAMLIISILALAWTPPSPTKTSSCHVEGLLPDSACTPGAVETTDLAVVCHTSTRGRREVSREVRRHVLATYGLARRQASGAYEIDHLIPLELGGSNDIANLWPEAAPGFHDKDRAENELHARVCAGRVRLEDAQRAIATNCCRASGTGENGAARHVAAPGCGGWGAGSAFGGLLLFAPRLAA